MGGTSGNPKIDVFIYPSLSLGLFGKFQEVRYHFVSHRMCQKNNSSSITALIQGLDTFGQLAEIAIPLLQCQRCEAPVVAGCYQVDAFYISKLFQQADHWCKHIALPKQHGSNRRACDVRNWNFQLPTKNFDKFSRQTRVLCHHTKVNTKHQLKIAEDSWSLKTPMPSNWLQQPNPWNCLDPKTSPQPSPPQLSVAPLDSHSQDLPRPDAEATDFSEIRLPDLPKYPFHA